MCLPLSLAFFCCTQWFCCTNCFCWPIRRNIHTNSVCMLHAAFVVVKRLSHICVTHIRHHNEIVRIPYRIAYIAGNLKVRHTHRFSLFYFFLSTDFALPPVQIRFFFSFVCPFPFSASSISLWFCMCKSFILPFIKPIFYVLCGILALALGPCAIACLPKGTKAANAMGSHNAIILSIFNSVCSNMDITVCSTIQFY